MMRPALPILPALCLIELLISVDSSASRGAQGVTREEPAASPCIEDFAFPEVQDSEVFQRYKDALIRIEVEATPEGTGYVIDAERGFVLTARHVVERALENSALEIKGRRPYMENGQGGMKLRIVDYLPRAVDLALLQAEVESAFSDVNPFEISFRVGKVLEPGTVVAGYALQADQPAPYPVTISEIRLEDRRYQAKGRTFEGDSGAPLLDRHGTVIGTTVTNRGHEFGLFMPMLYAEPLLTKISMSERTKEWDVRLLKQSFQPGELRRVLSPSHKQALTNLDLLGWAVHVNGHRDDYATLSRVFSCPILQAYVQRELGTASVLIAQLTTAIDFARANLRQGRAYKEVGATEFAAASLSEARNGLKSEAASYVQKNPGGLAKAFCAGVATDPAALPAETTVVFGDLEWLSISARDLAVALPEGCGSAQADPELASLLRDYALATFELSDFPFSVQEGSLVEAKNAALGAVAVSPEGQFAASNLALLGDILLKEGLADDAAQAYAGAYKQFGPASPYPWLQQNWVYAMQRSGNPAWSGSIETAPTLTLEQALSGFVNL